MPDSTVSTRITVLGGAEAIAQLQAYRAEMTAIAGASTGAAKLSVDTTAVKAAQTEVAGLSTALQAVEGNAKGATLSLLGMSAGTVGVIAVGAALGVAVHQAEQFQQSMANLQAVLHANAEDFAALGAGIQASARSSVFGVTQIADADRILAKSGADANAIMREQADVLNLASAANTNATDAAAGMVTAQKSFGLAAKDSTEIANDLARAVDSSVGSFADMTEALKQVGPVAQQAGLDLATTTNAIAALENAGLSGDTGAGLKIFLQRLEAPSTQAQQAIHNLGLEVYDANGKMRSLADIADQLRLKTQGLTEEAKNLDLTQIFGARGVRVADIFANQGSDGLQAVIDHEHELGTAADIANTKLATLSGQMKQLTSSSATVAANVGGVLVPALSAAGSEATDLLNSIAKLTGALSDLGGASKYGQQISGAISGATSAPPGEQPFTQDEQRNNLLREQQKRMADIAKLQASADAAKGDILGHLLGDDGGKAQLDQAQEGLRQINAELAKLDPATVAAGGIAKLSQEEANLADQFSRGKVTMEAALAQAEAWGQTAIRMGADTVTVTNSLKDYEVALKNIANAQYEQRYAELQTLEAERQRAMKLADQGAPNDLITAAVFGKGNGLDPALLVAAEAQLKQWQDDQAVMIAGVKSAQESAAKDVAAAQKQADADVAAAQKQHLQDIVNAAQSAQSAIGSINLATGGLDSLTSAAAGLDDIRAKLAALGQNSPHLDTLSALADQFKTIADAEDTASAATRAFNLTLTETNKSIQALGSLKSEYLSALDAAEKRQAQGTATQSDLDIIKARSSVLSTIDGQVSQLQQRGNVDILGKLQNLPDYVKADDTLRDMIAQIPGGAKQLELDVQTNIKAAQAELQAVVDATHQTTLKVTVQYQLPDGTPISAAQIDHPTGASPIMPGGYSPYDEPASGYARPTTIRSTGGGPYGNDTLAQGGSGGAAVAGGGTIRYSDYQKVLAGYPGSPIANQGAFNDLTSVSQQMGVDPRTLMAIMQTESGYGANAGKIGQQFNYGGMGVNDRGYGHDSGVHATDGGPEYAGYNDFKSFLMDISAWVKQNGSSFSNYQTADQGQAKNSTMAQLQSAVPLVGGGATDAAANTVGAQIVAKALQSVGQDKLVDYCEQFVEETVQAITGKRGATGKNENSANAALAAAKQQGLVTSNPQPGDLVYYGDAAAGHVAIYMGDGKQISTYDKGNINDPTARQIHVESVGAGAQYVHVPGVSEGGANVVSAAATTVGAAAGRAAAGTVDATAGGTQQVITSAADIQKAFAALNAEIAKMDQPSIAGTKAELTSILPVLTQMQEQARQIGDAPLTSTEKQQAAAAAWQQSLDFARQYAVTVQDIENHTGSLADDTEKLATIVGGPLAQAYAQAAVASAQITAANSAIAGLETAQKAADSAHQAALKDIQQQGQAAQQASQAAQQALQAQQQAAQRANQDAQSGENSRFQGVTRSEQDQQRALQFSQQLQGTDLQNSLVDVQKRQQSTVYNRTASEQVVAGQVGAAGTNQEAGVFAASLAAMHDRDLKQKDADTKEIDDIQTRIRLQQKQANLDSYNLQTETIQEQRKHEDIMQGLQDQATEQQRMFQDAGAALSAQSQQQQASIQAATDAENTKYQAEKDANQTAIDAQNAIKDAAQAALDTANQAMQVWQQTGQVISTAAGNATQSSFLQSQPVGGGSIRRLASGGTVPIGGQALVGESAMEHLRVTSQGAIVTPLATRPASQGGAAVVNLNLGDLNLMLSEADKQDIKAYIAAKVNGALRSQTAAKRASGVLN